MYVRQIIGDLQEGGYRYCWYRLFTLHKRKLRVTEAAPFRDRVLHQTVMNVIELPPDKGAPTLNRFVNRQAG